MSRTRVLIGRALVASCRPGEIAGAEPFEIEGHVPVAGSPDRLDDLFTRMPSARCEVLERDLDPGQVPVVAHPHGGEAEPPQSRLGGRPPARACRK